MISPFVIFVLLVSTARSVKVDDVVRLAHAKLVYRYLEGDIELNDLANDQLRDVALTVVRVLNMVAVKAIAKTNGSTTVAPTPNETVILTDRCKVALELQKLSLRTRCHCNNYTRTVSLRPPPPLPPHPNQGYYNACVESILNSPQQSDQEWTDFENRYLFLYNEIDLKMQLEKEKLKTISVDSGQDKRGNDTLLSIVGKYLGLETETIEKYAYASGGFASASVLGLWAVVKKRCGCTSFCCSSSTEEEEDSEEKLSETNLYTDGESTFHSIAVKRKTIPEVHFIGSIE